MEGRLVAAPGGLLSTTLLRLLLVVVACLGGGLVTRCHGRITNQEIGEYHGPLSMHDSYPRGRSSATTKYKRMRAREIGEQSEAHILWRLKEDASARVTHLIKPLNNFEELNGHARSLIHHIFLRLFLIHRAMNM